MKVTVVKHGERYSEDLDWPAHLPQFTDFLAHHGFVVVLYDKDDFQANPLITDVTVLKRQANDDDSEQTHAMFWLSVTLGSDVHDVLCWTIVDLFEVFEMMKLLPNV